MGAAVGGGCLLVGYATYKKYWPLVQEIRARVEEMQKAAKESKEFEEKSKDEQMSISFEQNTILCGQTVRVYMIEIRDQINTRFDTDTTTKQLKDTKVKME